MLTFLLEFYDPINFFLGSTSTEIFKRSIFFFLDIASPITNTGA